MSSAYNGCSSCRAPVGRMNAHPANDLYWTQELPMNPKPSISARIPTNLERPLADNFPVGYMPPGLGYGGMYLSAGWGLFNYGTYRTFYPDIQPSAPGATGQ